MLPSPMHLLQFALNDDLVRNGRGSVVIAKKVWSAFVANIAANDRARTRCCLANTTSRTMNTWTPAMVSHGNAHNVSVVATKPQKVYLKAN